jgi:hypothetical protein
MDDPMKTDQVGNGGEKRDNQKESMPGLGLKSTE